MRYHELKIDKLDEGLFNSVKNAGQSVVNNYNKFKNWNSSRKISGQLQNKEDKAYRIGLNDFRQKFYTGLASGISSRALIPSEKTKTSTDGTATTTPYGVTHKASDNNKNKDDYASPGEKAFSSMASLLKESILNEGAVENWVEQIISGQARAGRWTSNEDYSTRAKQIGSEIENKLRSPTMQNEISKVIQQTKDKGAPAINSALRNVLASNLAEDTANLWDLMWSWSQLGRQDNDDSEKARLRNKIEKLEQFLQKVAENPEYLKSPEAETYKQAMGILAKS